MLNNKKLPMKLWVEAISTTCYIINRVYMHLGMGKTPYEIQRGKKPNLSYFYIFRSKWYILNNREHLGKFDSKSDEGGFFFRLFQ